MKTILTSLITIAFSLASLHAADDGFVSLFNGKPLEGWNKYRITCKGNDITIEVNSPVTTDIEDDKDASGPIGVQHHGEKGQTFMFRNLRIKELK